MSLIVSEAAGLFQGGPEFEAAQHGAPQGHMRDWPSDPGLTPSISELIGPSLDTLAGISFLARPPPPRRGPDQLPWAFTAHPTSLPSLCRWSWVGVTFTRVQTPTSLLCSYKTEGW